jgi:hypothetical protein
MLSRLAAPATVRRRWLPWVLVPALAVVGALLLVTLSSSEGGVVISTEPGLERFREGVSQTARAGTGLRAGDLVRTAAGRAFVSLDRRSVVSLEPHTSLEVGRASVAARLTSGRARFQVARQRERFQVQTAAGTIIVTGTTFEVAVLGRPPSVRVLVHLVEGSLRIEGEAGQLALGPGESAFLAAGAAPRRIEVMRAAAVASPVAPVAAPGDCTREGGADCDEIAQAVKTLEALEDPISDAERRALAEATSQARSQHLVALRRLHTEVVGGEATASYDVLVEEIQAALPPEELRDAHSQVAATSTPAGRFVGLLRDTNEAIRAELTRRVPLHRVDPILSSRAARDQGGKP